MKVHSGIADPADSVSVFCLYKHTPEIPELILVLRCHDHPLIKVKQDTVSGILPVCTY